MIRKIQRNDFFPVSNRAPQNGNLERRGIKKIRISCSISNMLQTFKTKRDMFYLWLHTTKHQRKKQESSRTTNEQWIYHVRPWNSQIIFEEHSKGRRYENSAESQKKEITWIPQRNTITERSWTSTSTTNNAKCPRTNKDTRTPTWKNLTEQQMKRRCTSQMRQTLSRKKQRHRKKLKNTLNTKKIPKKKKQRDQIILKTRCRPMVIVVIMDTHWSTSSWWEYSPSRTWQQWQ